MGQIQQAAGGLAQTALGAAVAGKHLQQQKEGIEQQKQQEQVSAAVNLADIKANLVEKEADIKEKQATIEEREAGRILEDYDPATGQRISKTILFDDEEKRNLELRKMRESLYILKEKQSAMLMQKELFENVLAKGKEK